MTAPDKHRSETAQQQWVLSVIEYATLIKVPKYKYHGKVYNSKGNFEEHLKETETKVTAPTQIILGETGDNKFKCMRMKAMWQCIEATFLQMMTYYSVSWDVTKRKESKPKPFGSIKYDSKNDNEHSTGHANDNTPKIGEKKGKSQIKDNMTDENQLMIEKMK